MKVDEIVAFNYLGTLGLGTPIFEPFGNRTPDFMLDNIGIEVRRLNQNVFIGGKAIGPENMDLNFPKIIEKVIRGFDSNYNGKSFWLTIKYHRSRINNIQGLKKEFKLALKHFLAIKPILPCTTEIAEEVEIIFYESMSFSGKTFHVFSFTDYDSGGWVLSTYLQNIKYSIEVKKKKILPFKNDFKKWWLLLVDRIGFGIREEEIQELKSYMDEIQFFEKVIVINPVNLKIVLEFGL